MKTNKILSSANSDRFKEGSTTNLKMFYTNSNQTIHPQKPFETMHFKVNLIILNKLLVDTNVSNLKNGLVKHIL